MTGRTYPEVGDHQGTTAQLLRTLTDFYRGSGAINDLLFRWVAQCKEGRVQRWRAGAFSH